MILIFKLFSKGIVQNERAQIIGLENHLEVVFGKRFIGEIDASIMDEHVNVLIQERQLLCHCVDFR